MKKRAAAHPRITLRAILLFLGLCVLLDLVLFALFHFGFDSCYGLLCLLS